MRTSEELVQELHRRMDEMELSANRRKFYVKVTAAGSVCLAAVVVLALMIWQLPVQTPVGVAGNAVASIFADNAALGYVTVALLAFCLGVFVTVFCYRMKRHMEEDRPDDLQH